MSRVRFSAVQDFSLATLFRPTEFGVHAASYTIGAGSYFPGVKAAGNVKLTTHLHPMSRSKKVGLYLHALI
jgi:hypothetical protein